MRKNYEKPAMQVVEIKMEQAVMIVPASSPRSLGGNVFNQQSIDGSNQAARVKRDCYNVWDEEW